ncbi:unnamed protein product [Somion occarium]|uniref:Uncharacterized protein n=1 Tax=Somion occarium TaxID=3059160 RepID=A0ABP1DHS5_9APHY
MPQNLPVVKADLSGKTVVIVGSNTGIGFEAAKHFARMNPARVICTCRSQEKAETTISEIARETGYTKAEGWVLELSDFSSVIAFAERFENESVPLDILVCNAAIALPHFQKTIDGWETVLQVNHLSLALLSLLLLPTLARTAQTSSGLSRLVIVSSDTHAWTTFDKDRIPGSVLETLNDVSFFDAQAGKSYSDTKLLNVLFTRTLANHLSPTAHVLVDTVNPGFCLSDLRRNIEDRGQWDDFMAHARTSEEGSRQLIWAALGPQGAGEKEPKELHGGYISDNQLTLPSPWVRSEPGRRVQEEVWMETLKAVSNAAPKVENVVSEYIRASGYS